MTNDDIKKWDDISLEYAKICETAPFKTQFIHPLVLENIGTIKSKKVLDIGCSSGVFARLLQQKGASVFGVDGSIKLLEIAKKQNKHQKITYQKVDLNKKIDFPSRYFDLVTAFHVIMDVEKYQNVISEAYRLLKSDGKIIITIPHPCFSHPVLYFKRKLLGRINPNWSKIFWSSYFERRKINKQLVPNYSTSYYHRTISDYLNEISKAGFVIEKFIEPKLPKKIAKEMNIVLSDFFPNTMIIIAKKIKKG